MKVDEHTKRRARQLDPKRVAEWLGLQEARPQHKYGCFACTSSDALHVNPSGTYEPDGKKCAARCFSCGATCSDTIDFAREARGCGFVEAVEWLCQNGGIDFDRDDHSGVDTYRPPAPPKHSHSEPTDEPPGVQVAPQKLTDWLLKRMPFDTFRRVVDAYERRMHNTDRPAPVALAYTILSDIYQRMELDEGGAGAAYLEDRGIPAPVARRAGVRSTSFAEWNRLAGDYPTRILEYIGFNRCFARPTEYSSRPFDHVLWFPYFDSGGELSTLRWREASDDEQMMGMATSGADEQFGLGLDSPHRPAEFYLAPSAIDAAKAQRMPVFLVEGELDALSIWAAGRPAVAVPGVSWVEGEWWRTLRPARTVVIAGDGDEPGKKFTNRAKRKASESVGERWADTTCGRAHWPTDEDGNDNDANDLRRSGGLADAIVGLEDEWGINENRRSGASRPAAV